MANKARLVAEAQEWFLFLGAEPYDIPTFTQSSVFLAERWLPFREYAAWAGAESTLRGARPQPGRRLRVYTLCQMELEG